MVMTFGQLMDHDMTLTEFTVGVDPQTDCGVSTSPCPSLSEKPNCTGIDLTPDSNRLSGDPNAQCIPLARSERDLNGDQVSCYR